MLVIYNTCLWSKADMVMQEASALTLMQRGQARMVTKQRVYGPCACRRADWTSHRIQTEVLN
jgi:hypothetical protein